jgi:tight adherence protein B
MLRIFENTLRAGYSLNQSLEILVKDLPAPVGEDIQKVLDETRQGVSLPEALDHWLARRPSEDLNLVIATLRVQFEVGGNLADKLNLLGQIMNKRSRLLSV